MKMDMLDKAEKEFNKHHLKKKRSENSTYALTLLLKFNSKKCSISGMIIHEKQP